MEAAEVLYRRSLELRRRFEDPTSPSLADALNALAGLLADQANLRLLLGEADAALSLRESEDLQPEAETKSALGGCLVGLGGPAEAEPLLLESYRTLVELVGQDALTSRLARKISETTLVHRPPYIKRWPPISGDGGRLF